MISHENFGTLPMALRFLTQLGCQTELVRKISPAHETKVILLKLPSSNAGNVMSDIFVDFCCWFMFVCCKRCERFILVSWLSLAEFGSGSPPDTVAGCCKRAEVQDELKQRKKKAFLVIPGGIQKDSERFGKIRKKLNLSDISRHLQIPRVAHSSHIRRTCRMF
jgi:hypothetical protein